MSTYAVIPAVNMCSLTILSCLYWIIMHGMVRFTVTRYLDFTALKSLVPEGAILVPLFIMLMTSNGAKYDPSIKGLS